MAQRFSSSPLRIGFLALTDAAPFVVAQERNLFERHGIEVELSREVGWATIREKIIYGELDAAHAPAPMLWATRAGIDSVACPVLTALILNHNGNAITLSNRLWADGIRDSDTLREEARRRSGERKLTFGVVYHYSSHHLLLRHFLRRAGINPDRDVRIVVVPPAQMFRNLSAGTIDGFCSGEPYNTVAVKGQIGWIADWSAAHASTPEKVLMATERFAFNRPQEHLALVAALHAACQWAEHPSNRAELVELLARSEYINQSVDSFLPALSGEINCGHGRHEISADFISFARNGANAPTLACAQTIQRELVEGGILPASLDRDMPHRLFREDLFRQATHSPAPELVNL